MSDDWEVVLDDWIATNTIWFSASCVIFVIFFVLTMWWCVVRFQDHETEAIRDTIPMDHASKDTVFSSDSIAAVERENDPLLKEAEYYGIACCVVAYAEREEEIKLNRMTFSGIPAVPIDLSIVVDGVETLEDQQQSPTFAFLQKEYGFDTDSFEVEFGCRVYRGRVGLIPFRVYCKGPACVRGKRQSHKLFFQILAHRIATKDLVKPFAIQMIDGDSGSPCGLDDVAKLLALLIANPSCAAVCSQILPANHDYTNFLLSSQAVAYPYQFKFFFGALSFFGALTTAVGMSVIYRYSAFLEGKSYDGLSIVEKYGSTSTNLFDLVMLDMAEDFGLTIFFLQGGFDTMLSQVTHFRTFVPATWQEFFGQQRRWISGALVGNFFLCFVNSPFFLVFRNARWLLWFYVVLSFTMMVFSLGMSVSVLIGYTSLAIEEWGDATLQADAGYIAFGVIWGLLLLYFALIFDRSVKDVVYVIVTASVVALALAVFNFVFSIIEAIYSSLEMVAVTILLPLLLVVDLRYWPKVLWGILPNYLYNTFVANVVLMLFVVGNIDSVVWGTRATKDVPSDVLESDGSGIWWTKVLISFLIVGGNIGLSLLVLVYDVEIIYLFIVMLSFQLIMLPVSMLEWKRQKNMIKYVSPRLPHSDYWPELSEAGADPLPPTLCQRFFCDTQ